MPQGRLSILNRTDPSANKEASNSHRDKPGRTRYDNDYDESFVNTVAIRRTSPSKELAEPGSVTARIVLRRRGSPLRKTDAWTPWAK
jgi:hypothetical protein